MDILNIKVTALSTVTASWSATPEGKLHHTCSLMMVEFDLANSIFTEYYWIAALQMYAIISSFTLWLNLVWSRAISLNIYWDSSTTNIYHHIQFYSLVEFDLENSNFTEYLLG